jgi:hypothetical protein
MAIDTLPMDFGSDKPFYIYVYRDTRPRKKLAPIYVGKGAVRNGRADVHWRSGASNKMLQRILDKIRAAGLDPAIEIVGWFDDEDAAFACEVELIRRFGRRNNRTGSLANYTDGGEGRAGYKLSPEAVEKTRAAHVGAKRSAEARQRMRDAWTEERRRQNGERCRGVPLSEEAKRKISEANRGRKRSAETRAKIGAAFRGRKQTPEQRAKSGAGVSRSWTPERRAAQAERMRLWRKSQIEAKSK